MSHPEQPNKHTPLAPVDAELPELDSEPTAPAAADEGVPLQQVFRQNFVLSEEPADRYSTPLTTELDPSKEVAIMPSASSRVMMAAARSARVTSEEDSEATGYGQLIGAASTLTPMDNGLEKAVLREDADWVQAVVGDTGRLAGGFPRLKARDNYTPEAARQLVRAKLNLGSPFSIPLWHSGFWITINPPTEGELLELSRRIAQEKIGIGRQTYGLMFSNTTAYTSRHLVDFVLEHMAETTLIHSEGDNLRQYIKLPDLELLIWGLACATYPTGFQYRRPCTATPDACRDVQHAKLNLARLSWTDQTKLSKRQKLHMANRTRHSMTLESIKLYQEEFTVGRNKRVVLSEDKELAVELRMPTIEDHLVSGFRWAAALDETYGRGMTLDENARQDYLLQQAQATMMREFAHCVANVQLGDNTFDNQDFLDNTLADLTAAPEIHARFESEVRAFLDDSLVSLIAIPTYICPACNKPQQVLREGSQFPELIALDVSQTFFMLAYQRTSLIRQRDLKAFIQ